ncbi:MAG: nucleoside kinase [Defluviitaleaceae bacterium]|nr:nucleoside kinase [Defluviitaleaceae bacterium]
MRVGVNILDITNPHGFRAYQRSVVFMMLTSFREVLGVKARILVEHSMSKNLFCEIVGMPVTEELLEKITASMEEMVKSDLLIEKHVMPIEEAISIAERQGQYDKVLNLNFRRSSNVHFYKLKDFYNYFYGPMFPSCKYLKIFKLSVADGGFIIQFEDHQNPGNLRPIKKIQNVNTVFRESSKWLKVLNVDTVGALNKNIANRKIRDIIAINEALHEKKVASIADNISNKNKKIVFIAGPTSSGKTTFAHRLAIQLKVTGINPHVISLDNYYRDYDPKENLEDLDLESINAIDVASINSDLENLLKGETVDIPIYDFVKRKKSYQGNFLKLSLNDVLIIEGIHGLNESISEKVPKDICYRVFISALTQLNLDDHNRISTSDTRLIRRMTRDITYRNTSARTNLAMWSTVLKGEAKYIFPYQNTADAVFNSALVYEMSILKQFAEPLLFAIDKTSPEYLEARRLIKFLDSFLGVSSEQVPKNSILREFIGGLSL